MGACYVSISFCGRSIGLPLIIHEHFCCNRGFAATTSLNAVSPASRQAGSPLRSVNMLFQVCLPSSQLRAPVSPVDYAVSQRPVMNNAGQDTHGVPRVTGCCRGLTNMTA